MAYKLAIFALFLALSLLSSTVSRADAILVLGDRVRLWNAAPEPLPAALPVAVEDQV